MRARLLVAAFALFGTFAAFAAEEPAPTPQVHRITGMNCPERMEVLRAALKDQAEVSLVSVDYEHAQATFAYNPKTYPPDRLRQLIATKGFNFKTSPALPPEKLTSIEIPIVGLDCQGCSLGAYNVVIKIDGVEQATASFKEGRITALIDPAKTNRTAIEDALKKARVMLKDTSEPKAP